jgi:hypothetical protein
MTQSIQEDDGLPPFHSLEYEIYLDQAKQAMKNYDTKRAISCLKAAKAIIKLYLLWRKEDENE